MSTSTVAPHDPRYPIGKFHYVPAPDKAERDRRIEIIASAPAKLRSAVEGLTEQQLNSRYREGGWTIRQVIHHVPDSHMQAYTRIKLALTEDQPSISTYNESAWAKLSDSEGPIEPSLALLEGLHVRWTSLLRSLNEEQWQCTFLHPELGLFAVERALALYVWHGEHHHAHVQQAMKEL